MRTIVLLVGTFLLALDVFYWQSIYVVIVVSAIMVAVIFLPYERLDLDGYYLDRLKRDINKIEPGIIDSIKLEIGNVSQTVNKRRVTVCIRNNDRYHPYETMLYVALHEIAHCMSTSWSVGTHNQEFQTNFADLLRKAKKVGYDLEKTIVPSDYCNRKSVISILKDIFLQE